MRTLLTYENGSLNPYVGRVGMFWDCPDPQILPTLWYTIQDCAYDWFHSVSIDWQPCFRLLDANGNQRDLPLHGDGETRLEYHPAAALTGFVTIRQESPRYGVSLLLCRNGRPMAKLPLGFAGERMIDLPHIMVFQMENPDPIGGEIGDHSGAKIDLAGLSDLRVQLRGGGPGPRSTKQTFVSYREKRA